MVNDLKSLEEASTEAVSSKVSSTGRVTGGRMTVAFGRKIIATATGSPIATRSATTPIASAGNPRMLNARCIQLSW